MVLDVESSGLDVCRDQLLSIAAVALHFEPARGTTGPCPRIVPGDSFELLIQHEASAAAPDKANILLHGIGLAAQRGGVAPAPALQALQAYIANAPVLAFHAAFDRSMLARAASLAELAPLPSPWLDLSPLAAALLPQVKAQSLDDWLAHFDIPCLARHQAAADALASAQLLLRLWPLLGVTHPAQGLGRAARLIKQRRWLPRV